MKSGLAAICAAAVCAAAGFSAAPAVAQTVEPARAQTTTTAGSQSKMKVCADEWNAKKAANETASLKYRDFVKECLSRTATAPEPAAPAAPARPAATAPAAPTAAAPAAPAPTTATPPASQPPAARPPAGPRTATPAAPTAPATAPAAPGAAVFPAAVSPKYSSESAGRARMHTCLDQYNANKAASANGNGGLNWIQAGGGYYSECNKRLKG
jgi:hypothetical protein